MCWTLHLSKYSMSWCRGSQLQHVWVTIILEGSGAPYSYCGRMTGLEWNMGYFYLADEQFELTSQESCCPEFPACHADFLGSPLMLIMAGLTWISLLDYTQKQKYCKSSGCSPRFLCGRVLTGFDLGIHLGRFLNLSCVTKPAVIAHMFQSKQ